MKKSEELTATAGTVNVTGTAKSAAKSAEKLYRRAAFYNIIDRDDPDCIDACHHDYCLIAALEGLIDRDDPDYVEPDCRNLCLDILGIQEYFKSHGFLVAKEAILHNYFAWLRYKKAGFRDELNRCHVLTPYGYDQFDLVVTELNALCDWQKTYEN